MDLPADQLAFKCLTLGLAAVAMVALRYPGEIRDEQKQRFIWRVLAICPFAYVVQQLICGLSEATEVPTKKRCCASWTCPQVNWPQSASPSASLRPRWLSSATQVRSRTSKPAIHLVGKTALFRPLLVW